MLRVTIDNYDLIIVDECESLARYITSTHFMKNTNSNLIVNDLEYKLQKAKNVIIMDADLSDRCINFYKKIMEIDDNELYILKNNKNTYNSYKIKYTVFPNWVCLILDYLKKNKKLVIHMESNIKQKIYKNILINLVLIKMFYLSTKKQMMRKNYKNY